MLQLVNSGQPVVVAVSGGADSVALLLALTELVTAGKVDIEIVVAHLNHQLRGAAGAADARWVRQLAKQLGHRSMVSTSNVQRRAKASNDNLEQAARRSRYEFLAKVARTCKATLIVTAHTMNDQAETMLINLIRGSGSRGLAGIEPVRVLTPSSKILLARPLAAWARRADTEEYCRSRAIEYRVDEMNLDNSFTRVRVRNELLPLLETFNPRVIETVTRTAQILREDNTVLNTAARRLLELALVAGGEDGRADSLDQNMLLLAPAALRRRALRDWLARCRGDVRRIERAHVIAIERLLASTKSGRTVELPGGAVYRQGGLLHYRPARTRVN